MAIGFAMQVVFLPETVYVREIGSPGGVLQPVTPTKPTLWGRYGIHIPKRPADKRHGFWFIASRPFVMFKFPVVVLTSFWFGLAYWCHVGITAELPLIFEPEPFNFSVTDVGLAAFSGLIGALIGEAYAGPAIDYIAKRCLKQGKEWRPEMRLKAIWPALVATPIDLIMFGVSIQFGNAWITPLVGQGIYIFGIEIATTVWYIFEFLSFV